VPPEKACAAGKDWSVSALPKPFGELALPCGPQEEKQRLYCGADHPLHDTPDDAITPEVLAAFPYAGRTYMIEEPICGVEFRWSAVTAHMEGTALPICSGAYLAFLPAHFAAPWDAAGAMRALAPDRFVFQDRFQVVQPRKARVPAVAVLDEFLRRSIG
jgi:DNA-binding transcriptional LysR family regulator